MERGLKQLGSVPEVGKLTTLARGQLVDAAKTAAMTAASSRIDALNERLQGSPAPDDDEETPRRSTRKGREDTDAEPSAESNEDERDDDERDDDEEPTESPEDDADERPRPRRRASGTARRRASDSGDEPRRNRARRSTRAPVRRAGEVIAVVADSAEKTARKTTTKAKDTAKDTAKNTAKDTVSGGSSPLTDAVGRLARTVTTRAATSLTDKVGSAAGRLGGYGSGSGGPGLLSAVTGSEPGAGRKAATGAVKGALSGAVDGIKDKISGMFGGGDQDKIKVTNIVEHVDVGVPVDVAYDQWTRFTDFPGFMKKVEHVEQVSDEKLRWKAQIFWSHRSWESTIVEQVPDERIVWRSEAPKGHVDGAVTFHELAPDLTRVLLVLEYHPQGLFERTGNLWRAQGRRARLELKHFQRHVMTSTLLHPDDVEGWRGEIHDGQVVDQEEPGEDEPADDTEAGSEERTE